MLFSQESTMKLELFFSCPIPVLSLESLQSKSYLPSLLPSFLPCFLAFFLFFSFLLFSFFVSFCFLLFIYFCFILFFLFFVILVFGDWDFLCIPGCPGRHSVDQGGLEIKNPSSSASQVLGIKAWATTTWVWQH